LHVPALIALILAISGGTDAASSNTADQASGKTETRAAIIIYLLVYVATCILWTITFRDTILMVSSQKRIFFCVLVALPLIAVRLLYSLISDFGHNPQFSLINGDTKIQLVMATLEEFAIVLIYTILGIFTPKSVQNAPLVENQEQNSYYAGGNVEHGRHQGDQPAYAQAAAQKAYNAQYSRN
jgi:hypothetical protein